MAFDPDAYLAKKRGQASPTAGGQNSSVGGFDPDAYLAKKQAQQSVAVSNVPTPPEEEEQGFLSSAASAVGGFVGDAFTDPKNTFKGLAKGSVRGLDKLGSTLQTGIGKVVDPALAKLGGTTVEELNKRADALGANKDFLKPQGKTQERAAKVGEFGTKAGIGGVLAGATGGLGLSTLGTTVVGGAASNLPFVPDAFEEGGVKGAALDMVLNTGIDIATLGAAKAFPIVKQTIKKGFKHLPDTQIAKLTKETIDKLVTKTAKASPLGDSVIPLTRLQKRAVEKGGDYLPSQGILGMVDRITSKIPGGRQVAEKHKQAVADAVMKQVSELGGDVPKEELANIVADKIKTNIKRFGDEFATEFGKIQDAGKLAGEFLKTDDIATGLRRTANTKHKVFKSMKGNDILETGAGLGTDVRKNIKEVVSNVEGIKDLPIKQQFEALRSEKTRFGNLVYSGKYKGPEFETMKDVLGRMRIEEEKFLLDIPSLLPSEKDALVGTLRKANEFYGETKAIREYMKSATGSGKEVAEKGFVNAMKALDNITQPSKIKELGEIVSIVDNDTKAHLKTGLISKLFRDSSIENGRMISVTKLNKLVNEKYGIKNLSNVLGDDSAKKLTDLITGMKNARTETLKFIDPTNPSGSGASVLEGFLSKFAAPSVAVGTYAAPSVGIPAVVAGSTLLELSRVAQKIITGQPFSQIEKVLAKGLAGGTVGATLAPEGDKGKGFLLGAGLGAGLGSIPGKTYKKALGRRGL